MIFPQKCSHCLENSRLLQVLLLEDDSLKKHPSKSLLQKLPHQESFPGCCKGRLWCGYSDMGKLQVKLANSKDTSPYWNGEVGSQAGTRLSQPAQLWGNAEFLMTGSALTPLKSRAQDRVGGNMEKIMLWKHGISALCWRYKKEWARLKNGTAFYVYLQLLFLLRAGLFLKNSEPGWRHMEPHTRVSARGICPSSSFVHVQAISFSILTRSVRIQTKPLPISLYLFSANMQNICVVLSASFRHFSSSKIVFQTFISITVIVPYLHFHFFQRARQFYSQSISHIPSSSAPLEQVLDKQQRTTLESLLQVYQTAFLFVCFWKLLWSFHDLTDLKVSAFHSS